MNHRLGILVGMLSILAALACAGPSKTPDAIEGAPVKWEGRSAEEVLAELRAVQARIEHLSAAFSFTWEPAPKGRPSGLHGAMLFSRKGGGLRLRITALGPFGQTYFDMVHENGEVSVYVPARDTVYRGRPSQAFTPEGGFGQTFGALFTTLSSVRAKPGGKVVRANGNLHLPLEEGYLVLDPAGGLLRAWHRPESIYEYSDYVRPGQGPPAPTRLSIRDRYGTLRVNCRLREVSPNPPPAGAFDLPLRDSTVEKPLRALERRPEAR